MKDLENLSILKVRLQHERHVVHARQRAHEIAEQLGFDRQTQVKIATATSELARNAFRYAHGGMVEFSVSLGKPPCFSISVSDKGAGIPDLQSILDGTYVSRTGLGKGLQGTRRLMDGFDLQTGSTGTHVRIAKQIPAAAPLPTAESVRTLSQRLTNTDVDAFEEVERQNQELMRTLEELRDKQEQLAQVNLELEDTNRGVVALYAELEQNATDLRRVSELKTSFLSNLSHEFRTPLNSILALCRILSDRADGDLSSEQEKQVSYIQRSAADLSDLVNDLLDLAKVEAGKIEIRPRSFTVADLFATLRGMLRTLLVSQAVDLTFSAAADLPELFTDEQKVSQILRNLISNALKFTEQGFVRVDAEQLGRDIVFRVSDDGIGIAPEDQERIFEEFEQIENEIQTRVRGTGLGLPLARQLASLLGGSLKVSSQVGVGSVFTATLPANYAGQKEPPAPEFTTPPAGPVVLVVEDNLETRFIHEAALKRSGLALVFARNLAEARNVLTASKPDVVVLDRMLEGEDSLHFIAESRGLGYRGGVVVVSVIDDARTPLAAGADAFLCKPIDAHALSAKVSELLLSKTAQTVLLVDDGEINRYLLREALERYHLRVVEARSGREALDLVRQEQLALIFMDVVMPGFTGLETLRELREGSAGTKAVPVVIHTSKDLDSTELAAIEDAGALRFSKQDLAAPDAAARLRNLLEHLGVVEAQ